MDRRLRKILTKKQQLRNTVKEVESNLKDSVCFNFSIDENNADGVVLINIETSNLALLEDCLNIIKKQGILTFNDHLKISF